MRQVAKPTPKAIKKKVNNDCSSLGFSEEMLVEIEVFEESATTTGVETKVVMLSTVFVPSVSVVVTMSVVGVDPAVAVFSVEDGDSALSFTRFSVWLSLFFFQKRPMSHQLLLQV